MENQHRKITGYRDLTQAEIDLMNEIKAMGESVKALVQKVRDLRPDGGQINRLEPLGGDNVPVNDPRWVAIATTDLQTGFMALTRSLAKPTTF